MVARFKRDGRRQPRGGSCPGAVALLRVSENVEAMEMGLLE
jgi:hypothetical protein